MKKYLRELGNLVRNIRRPNITGKNIRSAIAMIVVFTTVYTLIMPAIALERNEASNMAGVDLAVQGSMHGNGQSTREYACSLDVHKHTDSCYAEKPVYDENGKKTGTKRELICGKADWVVHTHDENCYIDGELVCDLPEHAEHVHTDACYSTKKVLTCGLEEGEDHTHTDECYTEERVLTCGESALHTHTIDCYEKGPDGESPVDMGWVTIENDEDGNQVINGDPNHLVCGQLELRAHQHTDACFVDVENGNLENSDAGQDAEGADDAVADVAGDEDASIAGESAADGAVGDDEDSAFVAGEGNEDGSLQAESVEPEDEKHLEDIEVVTDENEKTDQGNKDLIKLHEDAEIKADDAKNDKDAPDADEDVAADKKTENAPAEAGERSVKVEGASYSLHVSFSEECGIPANAEFRATAISENREDYDAYRDRALSAVENYTSDEKTRAKGMPGLFDLSIYAADGSEIQPAAPLSVSIELGNSIAEDAKGVYAVHFPNTNTETVMRAMADNPVSRAAQVMSEKITGTGAEVIETTEKDGTVKFEAESLSVYAIVYTVDFEYSVNGKVYQFSLPGGGFVSLTDLVEVLGIIGDTNPDKNDEEIDAVEEQDANGLLDVTASDAAKKFVADVASVDFSSPELVWVGKVENETIVDALKEVNGLECEYSAELTIEQIEKINAQTVEAGDWALISLKPFTSEETLTVTMTNGEQFTIKVTDAQLKKTVIDAKGDTWEITVTYDDSGEIPEDAELKVEEILPEDEKYDQYYQKAMEKAAGSEVTVSDYYARFFDIEIHADGQKIEPKALVTVKIELADVPEEEKLAVVHFEATRSDDGTVPVLMDAEFGEDIRFETESFSVYGVITVPEAQPDPAVTDLDGKSFTISHDSRYVTTNITPIENNNNTNGFGKTTSVSQATTWFFEQPEGTSGNAYYIYTLVNDQKQYLNLTKNYNNTDRANASLSGNPQTFTVTNEGNSYRLSTQSDGTTYYLDEHNGNSGNAFAGWHGATNNGILTLNFSSQPVMQDNGQYMTLVKYADKYYIVNNDGSLTEVEYDDATKTVEVDDPMLWNVNQNNPNGHIWFNSKETGFEWRQTASDWYRRYLDPSVSGAITEENANNVDVQYDYTNQDGSIANHINRNGNKTRALESQTAVNIYNDPNDDKDTYKIYHGAWDAGQNYLGVELDENGVPIRLVGQKNISDAAEFVFASPTAVKAPNYITHTVDHIDVSIEGSANVSIPLAYGNYYGEHGDSEDPIKVVTSNTKLELSRAQMVDPSQLKITSEDMKRATITAVRADNGENLDDAFYITGFSGNVHTSLSADQVRIEGSFLVADLRGTEYETIDGGRYSQNTTYRNNVRTARLNNKVEYTVTVVKPLTYNLIDPELGQLYDEDGNAITVTVDVAFSASFNYWDNGNECPAVHYASTDGEAAWRAGGVDSSNLSGMDFVLGGDAENPDSPLVALEITKVIMDEEGNRIELRSPVTNYFDIYEKRNATNNEKNGVAGLHVIDSLNHPEWQADDRDSTLHDGYTYWRTKRLTVDDTGSAIVFDFNATDAMYYIVEKHDEESLPEIVTDKSGEEWTYVKTYIETEYVRRDDDAGSHDEFSNKTLHPQAMHITEEFTRDDGSYASIPEVAGNFVKLNNEHKKEGFLEFYVYNVYKKVVSETDITLKKVDKDDVSNSNPEYLKGASFTISKYDENFQVKDTEWGTSGSKTVSDTKNPDGTYTLNGIFNFEGLTEGFYKIEETSFPDGYVKLSSDPTFKVEKNSSNELEITLINNPDNLLRLVDDELTIVVGNTPGVALPNTGGPGTRLFTILGSILILGAGVLLWRRRRLI